MSETRFLLVGLGNPGREHQADRHNVGFMLMDQLAREHGLAFARVRHQAMVVSGEIAGRRVVVAKPQTYMNESGRAVSRLLRFYQIASDSLLVAFDDLDLPLGAMRFRADGGSGGHKGMRSIIEQVGSQQFARLRLGIGRPPGRMEPADYVLQPFGAEERVLCAVVLAEAAEGVVTFLREGITLAMSRHNQRIEPEPGESVSIAVSGDTCGGDHS